MCCCQGSQHGAFSSLIPDFLLVDVLSYKNFFRMDKESLMYLLEKVRPMITRQKTVMRLSVAAAECLAATVVY